METAAATARAGSRTESVPVANAVMVLRSVSSESGRHSMDTAAERVPTANVPTANAPTAVAETVPAADRAAGSWAGCVDVDNPAMTSVVVNATVMMVDRAAVDAVDGPVAGPENWVGSRVDWTTVPT